MFGNDFETAESRDVYLPAGRGIDYESGTVYEGPITLEDFPIPRTRIPVFIGGKVVIVGKSTDVPNALDAEVFPVTEGVSEYIYKGKLDLDHPAATSVALQNCSSAIGAIALEKGPVRRQGLKESELTGISRRTLLLLRPLPERL